jgi:hypothetical protein
MTIIHTPYLPFNFDGMALRWIVLVKHGHDSIIPHELIHIEQQKRLGFLRYMFKYLINKDFRVQMEFEAYFYGSKLNHILARTMAEKYRQLCKAFPSNP